LQYQDCKKNYSAGFELLLVYRWVDGWMDGGVGGWMNGWMVGGWGGGGWIKI